MAKDDRVIPATVRGLDFTFTPLGETQMALLGRSSVRAVKAAKKDDREGIVYAVAQMLDIIESAITDDGDRDEIVNLMIRGELEVEELMSVMEKARADADEEEKIRDTTPRVHRGRAK